MQIKKFLFKSLPYVASILAGGIFFYLLTPNLDSKYYDLCINISAAFFAIPLIYFFYELARNFSQRKLNKKIFAYGKMQVDTEVLSIINQLLKTVYSLNKRDFSPEGTNKLLSLKKSKLKKIMLESEYLGFQVFKAWEASEENLHEVLKNPLVLGKIENEQITSIIELIEGLRGLEGVQKIMDLYKHTGKKSNKYKVVKGTDISVGNKKYPNRYLLMEKLAKNVFTVYDFGDIPKDNLDKTLYIYKINSRYLEMYCEKLFDLLEAINKWLSLTGREFIIDLMKFRLKYKKSNSNILK